MPPRYSLAPNRHSMLPTSHYGHRQSMLPPSTASSKPRQYAHLQSQLSQLNANLTDLEELLRMTATQCENFKILGGLMGGFFMAAEKVFEDTGTEQAARAEAAAAAKAAQEQAVRSPGGYDEDEVDMEDDS